MKTLSGVKLSQTANDRDEKAQEKLCNLESIAFRTEYISKTTFYHSSRRFYFLDH